MQVHHCLSILTSIFRRKIIKHCSFYRPLQHALKSWADRFKTKITFFLDRSVHLSSTVFFNHVVYVPTNEEPIFFHDRPLLLLRLLRKRKGNSWVAKKRLRVTVSKLLGKQVKFCRWKSERTDATETFVKRKTQEFKTTIQYLHI